MQKPGTRGHLPDTLSAMRALDQLIDKEQVFALIAPLAPALEADMAARLEQAGVPLIGPLSLQGATQASREIFEPLPGLREQMIALANYATATLDRKSTRLNSSH